MANPNIVGVSVINGETETSNVSTTGTQLAHNNPSVAANRVFKVNVLSISNVDSINDADITVAVRTDLDSTPVAKHLVKTVTVPADSTLIVIDKNTSIYLKENMDLYLTASAANDLEAVVSYEIIS